MGNLVVANSREISEERARRAVSSDHTDLIVSALEKLLVTATGKLNYNRERIKIYAKSIIDDLEKLRVTFDDIARAFKELKESGYKGSEYGGLPTSRELIRAITFQEKPPAPKAPEGPQPINFKYEVIERDNVRLKRVLIKCDGGCGRTLTMTFPDEYSMEILKNSVIRCTVCEKLVRVNK